MSGIVDVAIIGAGPYGLSLAAHLRAAGVNYRHFGMPMRLWRESMPQGMYLKSQGFASNLSDPRHAYTLEAFCQATNEAYLSCRVSIVECAGRKVRVPCASSPPIAACCKVTFVCGSTI